MLYDIYFLFKENHQKDHETYIIFYSRENKLFAIKTLNAKNENNECP